jgi:hypothetical protein
LRAAPGDTTFSGFGIFLRASARAKPPPNIQPAAAEAANARSSARLVELLPLVRFSDSHFSHIHDLHQMLVSPVVVQAIADIHAG